MTGIIGDRYEQYEAIGRGGMGVVYRGKDTLSGQDVAIKILHPDRATEEQIARFQREGAALRDLNHPNIVKMLDAFQEGDNYYLVMEYVSGGDLNSLIQQDDLSPENIVAMGIDLADALTRAHKLGIIHRDLKPANVLIADDGTLRLTDFGIAHVRHQETLGDSDNIVGTVNYMAPETLSGGDVSASIDIWAFGIMFFEMLTRQVPFQRDSVSATLIAITTDPLPDIRDFVPDISAELEDLVYRMLDRDVHNRISSVRYVGAILEDIQQGRSKQRSFETRFETEPDIFSLPVRNNLPEQLTEFVGREAEIGEVQRLLDDPSTRLITILAPGGMGKTRLSLEVARRNLDHYDDGVYFIELANISDVQAIIPQIADAVGLSLGNPQQSSEEALLDFLRSKQMLLVMDNYEHLLDGADIVGKILESAPHVTIIATSRQRLQQRGETLLHLSGMDFPDWETPEDAANYAAVRLFTGSAVRSRPDFEITIENLPSIARICRMVQGMPLGIVLAAAWVAVLEPAEIASELAGGIDFLEAEEGDLPSRQQSIRVVMDYAWHMISDADRAAFMALSVFENGFTRGAASKIAGATIRQLMKFVNLSLLSRDADTGRYTIHELLRQYTLEKLEDSGDMGSIQQQHAEYYADMATRILQQVIDAQAEALHQVEKEFENIKSAWSYSLENGRTDLINDYVILMRSWMPQAYRGQELQAIIADSYKKYEHDQTISQRYRGNMAGLYACSKFYDAKDTATALSAFDSAVPLLDQYGEPADLAVYFIEHSVVLRLSGELERSLEVARSAFTKAEVANQPSLMARGAIAISFVQNMLSESNNLVSSDEWLYRANELARQAGNRPQVAITANNLASSYIVQQRYAEAREYLDLANEYNKAPFRPSLRIYVNKNLSRIDLAEGDYERAEARLRENVKVADATQISEYQLTANLMLTDILVLTGRYQEILDVLEAHSKLYQSQVVNDFHGYVIDMIEALARWGLGERDSLIPRIGQAVANLARISQPPLFSNVLMLLVSVNTYLSEYHRALIILGLLRAAPFLAVTDQAPLLQEADSILRDHFSEDEYARISAEGTRLDWNTFVNDLYEEYQTDK